MAISNYTELKAAVYKWLKKTTSDAYLDSSTMDNVIFLAEKELSRRLKIRQLEEEASLSLTAGDNSVSLPSDFVETVLAYYGNADDEIIPVSRAFFAANELYSSSGKPKYYYIKGDEMIFGPKPDTSYTVTLEYREEIPNLSGAALTNSVLTRFPDLYMMACEKQAYHALEDTENELKTEAKLEAMIAQINKADQRANLAKNTRGTARAI